MKKFVLFLLLFPSVFLAQMKLDTVAKTVSFSKVYDVEYSKEQIRQKVKEWIAINFKDANEVIKLDNEDKVIAKGYFDIYCIANVIDYPCQIYFITEISFKEKKYKLDFYTFELKASGYTQPIENYYFSDNYNYYKNMLLAQKEAAIDKFIIKYYDELLNDSNQLNKMHSEFSIAAKQISISVTLECELNAESLYNYVSSKTKEDW